MLFLAMIFTAVYGKPKQFELNGMLVAVTRHWSLVTGHRAPAAGAVTLRRSVGQLRNFFSEKWICDQLNNWLTKLLAIPTWAPNAAQWIAMDRNGSLRVFATCYSVITVDCGISFDCEYEITNYWQCTIFFFNKVYFTLHVHVRQAGTGVTLSV